MIGQFRQMKLLVIKLRTKNFINWFVNGRLDWFTLLKKLNNVIGFIGIAAVIDFTKYKMWNKFSHKIKKEIKKGKIHYLK